MKEPFIVGLSILILFLLGQALVTFLNNGTKEYCEFNNISVAVLSIEKEQNINGSVVGAFGFVHGSVETENKYIVTFSDNHTEIHKSLPSYKVGDTMNYGHKVCHF